MAIFQNLSSCIIPSENVLHFLILQLINLLWVYTNSISKKWFSIS